MVEMSLHPAVASRMLSLRAGMYQILVCSWERPAQFAELVHAAPHTEPKAPCGKQKPSQARAGKSWSDSSDDRDDQIL